MNYAHKLITLAQEAKAKSINVILQDALLQHAMGKGGMIKQLALVDQKGVCAALTVTFVEDALVGRLASFNQNSLADKFPSTLRSQFGSMFFTLHGGNKGQFEIACSHLKPIVFPVKVPSKGFAFETTLSVAVVKAAAAVAKTVAITMHGDGGHVIGLKVVHGGTSSFFDANAGLYRFDSVDDLKYFCLSAYAIADYKFTDFKVVSFGRVPLP